MEKPLVPYLPENAPFTPEQRSYLNGFFAGLFSWRTAPSATAPVNQSLRPLTILFGSQTGNAEGLAKRAAKEASKQGFASTTFEMTQYPREHLTTEKNLLIITSTYGDGDPPDNAKTFWEFLSSADQAALSHINFSVLALGDSNYPKFCACGKNFDQRLEQLGARRIHPRIDCDVDYEETFVKWLSGVLASFDESQSSVISGQLSVVSCRKDEPHRTDHGPRATDEQSRYNKKHPFPAPLLTNRKLNGDGSAKDTRHVEIALDGSGLIYEVGDALGVMPTNCQELVEEILAALACSGDEAVLGREGQEVPLREALLRHYEITRIPKPILEAVAQRSNDPDLKKLTAPDVNGELTQFLYGREIIDLLFAFPNAKFCAEEFVGLLKKLQPRLYSISSSPKVRAGQVHLTVSAVRYESLGRRRKGVCSTFLADRTDSGTFVPVFVHTNKGFRPPTYGHRPIIMIGPGTGIAPFRAFLEERRAVGATGRNWLFFGDQHERTDFLYRNELEAMHHEGTLARLDTAFSRDQAEKVYVQHRLLEHAKEVYAWLEEGAHFYVCGDASRMAKVVHQALHEVVEVGGGLTPDRSAEYVENLKAERRYQRDVY
jgi:sulfite reductase (NADPH) flavoprotein alpha-component